ncbi:MAG: hypothetical protein LBN08_03895 [Lactobacillales bacterium]|jgi:hypothetical protein|nr:hypothetical protein [Lactobacillales bacterium]
MLKNYIKTIGIALGMLAGTMLLAVFAMQHFSEDSGKQKMQEAIRTSAYSNLDRAARVTERELWLDKAGFEEDFAKAVDVGSGSVSFDYIDEPSKVDGFTQTKAIKVRCKGYTATSIVEVSDE